MRVYGFGEGLIAKATQPRQPAKDEQIAQLRAEVERLRGALEGLAECHKGRCDSCNAEIAPEGYCGCEAEETTEYRRRCIARAALGKGAV